MTDEPKAVLDVGCGTGLISRNLMEFVDRVDGVDFSENMIETAKILPNGNHPGINWICGLVEEVLLSPPYALITAGESLHWMDWEVVFPRFRECLTRNGYMAIVGQKNSPMPWDGDLFKKIIPTYATNQDFVPYNLVEELESRNLFHKNGEKSAKPVSFQQIIEDYVESFHSMNGFSRERMTEEAAHDFDSEVRELVSKYCPEGEMELQSVGKVVWGNPTTK
jgi:ubiquinone/menaquinone biosynthesis C-methylase UbiE